MSLGISNTHFFNVYDLYFSFIFVYYFYSINVINFCNYFSAIIIELNNEQSSSITLVSVS